MALGVEYLRDFVMLLAFDVDGRGPLLEALREIFAMNRFEKRHMKDVMHPMHRCR
jgi:hypothetical protein